MANKCSTIEVTLKGKPEEVLEEVKKLASKNDLDVSGNAEKGTIKHRKVDVKGTYTITGQKVKVSMEENYWLAHCDSINEEIKKWFQGK